MSRHHLREDKTCLNCGFIVTERFCSRCGQENTELKESFLHLVGHFFSDITHFDSQIFTTIKDLVVRPGFLTREYIAGRRLRYLNPIRMYVFISAVFFLVMFTGDENHSQVKDNNQHAANLFRQQLADSLRGVGGVSASAADSIRKNTRAEIADRLDTAENLAGDMESISFSFGSGGIITIDMVERRYNSLAQYDSIQQKQPDSTKDQGIMRWMLRNNTRLKEERGGRRSHVRIEENLQHTIPKIMFVLLPLFALITGLFYSRKKYLYVQHAVFSIHFHSFVFLFFLVSTFVSKLITSDWVAVYFSGLVILLVFVYLIAALRGMYRQALWLSALKALVISLLYAVLIIVMLGSVVVIAFLRA